MSAGRPANYPYPAQEVLEDPYPFYEAMRTDTPVYQEPKSGVFFVSRLEDITYASQHHEIFTSKRSLMALSDPEIAAIRARGFPDSISLTANDPPEHQRFRSLVTKVFTPKKFAALEPNIRALSNSLIDAFIGEGKADLHAQFAKPLPLIVIADLLDLDHADVPDMKQWSDDYTDTMAAQACPMSRKRTLECVESLTKMQLLFSRVIKAREAQPGDDIISQLLAANAAAEDPIDHAMLVDMLRIFLIGGNETTTGGIEAMMHYLLVEPGNFERVSKDPALIALAIEEALRLQSPSQWALRNTTRDTELGGTQIPAGSRVCLLWGSANRDAAKFGDSAAEFSLDRANSRQHIAFGLGVHFCVGAPLARLEMKVALEQFIARLKHLRLAAKDAGRYNDHPIIRGMRYLHVEFDPA